MKIGIFANPIILEKAGVGRYASNLVREILKQDKKNEYILFANFFQSYAARKKLLGAFVKETGNTKVKIRISRIPDVLRDFLSGTQFPMNWWFREKIDVFFTLFPAHCPRKGFKKQVCIFHDLVFARYPQTQGKKFSYYYLTRTANAVKNCQKLFCISHSTKKDLVSYFHIDKDKIEIISPAVDEKIFYPRRKDECLRVCKKYKIDKPYLLAVGTLEPRKNLESLINAFMMLPLVLQNKYQLVLTGMSGWHNENLMEKIEEMSNFGARIIKTGYVSDYELSCLYSGAAAFIYPSFYEGFGLPSIEAMACGVPVISADTSSFPEVVGQAGILINPKKTEELTRAIRQILSDQALRKKLIKKGFSQVHRFSWPRSAKKAIEIFQKI
jgi:glycosyltransferase involved in cell wall biosynthesis